MTDIALDPKALEVAFTAARREMAGPNDWANFAYNPRDMIQSAIRAYLEATGHVPVEVLEK